jgi:hypothetical protein
MIHRWLTKLGRNSSGSGGGKLIAAVLNAHPPSTTYRSLQKELEDACLIDRSDALSAGAT